MIGSQELSQSYPSILRAVSLRSVLRATTHHMDTRTMTGREGTCRVWCCPELALPGELCRMHARPLDPDLERQSRREADGRHRRIG